MEAKRQTVNRILSALGLLALGFLYVLWLGRHSYPLYARLSAFLSVVLFAALGLRFVPCWTVFWSPAGQPEPVPTPEPAYMGLKLFGLLLALDALVLLASWPLRLALGYGESFSDALRSWRCADGVHYLDIARDWYLSEGSMDRLPEGVGFPRVALPVSQVGPPGRAARPGFGKRTQERRWKTRPKTAPTT